MLSHTHHWGKTVELHIGKQAALIYFPSFLLLSLPVSSHPLRPCFQRCHRSSIAADGGSLLVEASTGATHRSWAVNARKLGWELSALIGCDRHSGPCARLHAPCDPPLTPQPKKKRSRQTHFHNPAPAAEVGLWCRSLARRCWLSSVRRSADWTRCAAAAAAATAYKHIQHFFCRETRLGANGRFFGMFSIYFFRWPPEMKLFCLTRALRVTFTRPSGHSLSS